MTNFDTIIIGAGAAGLICAWQAGLRGRSVCIIEHTQKIAEKIRISGGGRCNFTNIYCSPDNFLSQNPHFCKSALARFTPYDFIDMMDAHGIDYHEKPYEEKTGNENARGQMFCDHSAVDIIDMLRKGCEDTGVTFYLGTKVYDVAKNSDAFDLETDRGTISCDKLVIASGGLSIPKIGASNFGYELAKSFGLNIITPRAALVPLTFEQDLLSQTKELSGISMDAYVTCAGASFREGLLFTHRGLSGPSILQISSYWEEGKNITVNMAPEKDIFLHLQQARDTRPKQMIRTILSEIMPARLAPLILNNIKDDTRIADMPNASLQAIATLINAWAVTPKGTEGYRTAEVTLGGVDTKEISSKTFESRKVKGLHFIGETLDVTGHLGGHNFQWAWASGWCCAQNL